jgi:hypothetical protein
MVLLQNPLGPYGTENPKNWEINLLAQDSFHGISGM